MVPFSPNVDRTLETPKGEVRIRFPARGIMHSCVRGHMDVATAEFIRDTGNEFVLHCRRMEVFHQWDSLETYDSAARKVLTDWGLDIRGNVIKVHILFRSKLVAMGVSVATVVLGNMIEAHRDPQKFALALQAAVAAAGKVAPTPPLAG